MSATAFLPTSADEMRARGWEQADIVLVSGDAYVDHPSFAAAVLGRVLEAAGFRVAILAQPPWHDAEAWRALGRPRLFYGVSAGNMDSMINHYTANRKRRGDDAYSPGGEIGLRPDRPTAVYAQRCREAWRGVPVVIGGIEASLRRIAHYDYWSDTVRPSMLVASKADLLVYGKGERPIIEVARRLAAGEPVAALRDMRSVAYLLGAREALPEHRFDDPRPPAFLAGLPAPAGLPHPLAAPEPATLALPGFDEVRAPDLDSKRRFADMTRLFHHETNPYNARRLTQAHGDRVLVQNPPALPLGEPEMDAIYALPYARQPHPRYAAEIPAFAMIKDSVTIMRGCFGGCTFCSITMHEGRVIQSRSPESIQREIAAVAAGDDFKGTISDIGGPTANMYRMRCSRPEVEAVCRRPSCIHPTVCKLLDTRHDSLLEVMRASRATPGVKRVLVASGIRMDLANKDDRYVAELARHHVGGHLKIAPEHASDRVLALMKKPGRREFDVFARKFGEASRDAGKEQYVVPYFIASHPGSGVAEMIELAELLKARGYRPRQVQDFIPAPMDIATCMYYTGLDPVTMKPVDAPRKLHDRRIQRALLQFFKPENYFLVREALEHAGRRDLVGDGPRCLIPAQPPPEAVAARRRRADAAAAGAPEATYVHAEGAGTASQTPAAAGPPGRSVGYRPGRKGAARRGRRAAPPGP